MYSIVLEFSEESLKKGNDVHWLALFSYFQYSFPQTFLCVLSPYKNEQSQAKVFMRDKDQHLESMILSNSQIVVNGLPATIIDYQEEPTCMAARARVLDLQLPSQLSSFETVTNELKTWFGATVNCLKLASSPGSDDSPIVSVAACNDEVLEAALAWLSHWQQRQQQHQPSYQGPATTAFNSLAGQNSVAGTSYAERAALNLTDRHKATVPPQPQSQSAAAAAPATTVSKRPRRPLFPEALIDEAAGTSSAQPEAPSQQQQQQQQRPYQPAPGTPLSQDDSAEFQLGASCQLRVDLADLTNLPGGGVDLVIVPTNQKLSLEFGLAKAVAGRNRDVDADCRRHLASLQGGALTFGDTYLCHKGGRGFRKILFIALPNDKRLGRHLGSGDSFRRAMDDCLERLMSRLARLASSEGLRRVAMPTLGSNLPLWGGGAHEWAEALAAAAVRLAESGALLGGGGGSQPALRLHVCCVARESAQALAGAVARRLPSGEETQMAAAAVGAASFAPQTDAPLPASATSAPPTSDVAAAEDVEDAAEEAMEVVASVDVVTEDAGCCVICSEEFSSERPAVPFHCDTAGTRLCSDCANRLMSSEQPTDGKCVLCFKRFRPAVGNQPANGSMLERVDQRPLPGYENATTIVVKYTFPSGTLDGVPYKGIARTAYFPNNDAGKNIVRRLRAAFEGRVVFQVGQSATTGNECAITWNTVHHKTRVDGGPGNHGYPDPNYLSRISDELSALGY